MVHCKLISRISPISSVGYIGRKLGKPNFLTQNAVYQKLPIAWFRRNLVNIRLLSTHIFKVSVVSQYSIQRWIMRTEYGFCEVKEHSGPSIHADTECVDDDIKMIEG